MTWSALDCIANRNFSLRSTSANDTPSEAKAVTLAATTPSKTRDFHFFDDAPVEPLCFLIPFSPFDVFSDQITGIGSNPRVDPRMQLLVDGVGDVFQRFQRCSRIRIRSRFNQSFVLRDLLSGVVAQRFAKSGDFLLEVFAHLSVCRRCALIDQSFQLVFGRLDLGSQIACGGCLVSSHVFFDLLHAFLALSVEVAVQADFACFFSTFDRKVAHEVEARDQVLRIAADLVVLDVVFSSRDLVDVVVFLRVDRRHRSVGLRLLIRHDGLLGAGRKRRELGCVSAQLVFQLESRVSRHRNGNRVREVRFVPALELSGDVRCCEDGTHACDETCCQNAYCYFAFKGFHCHD
ncbi:hypothetical protein BN871_CJ_00050 [Paenibacillus sp. P22]|nr:hypothetical protein BN871_CJ_00050 [Paenibacillus sp. P22]